MHGVLYHLFPYAAIISLLGFMEAISIAKAMAAKTGQRLDPTQELIGQGWPNLFGAMGKSFPTSGSFSRSAVNLQAGAVSGLSSVVHESRVLLFLFFFTPLLNYLPQWSWPGDHDAVIGPHQRLRVRARMGAKWYDGAILHHHVRLHLAFAPHLDKGDLHRPWPSRSSRFCTRACGPHVVSLARARTEAFPLRGNPRLKECEHIAMVRFDGPCFFPNASYLDDKILQVMRRGKTSGTSCWSPTGSTTSTPRGRNAVRCSWTG